MTQYRQGHILLNPIPKIPTAAMPAKYVPGHAVIATGESGREHVFKSERVAIFQMDGSLYIEVIGDEPITLEHPEHEWIEVEPGTYRIVEQREADPFRQERRSYD